MSIVDIEKWFLKMRVFLFFQISQETSIAREVKVFLDSPLFWISPIMQALDEHTKHNGNVD
jgi:hypothetical protein